MIPKQQKLEYFWNTDVNDNSLYKTFEEYKKDGWIIHQIIPNGGGCFYLLLYKY